MPQPSPLPGSHTPGYYPLALITRSPGTRQIGIVPMPHSPLKLFRLAKPKLGYPANPKPFHRAHTVPPFPLPPDQLRCFPMGPPIAWCALSCWEQ